MRLSAISLPRLGYFLLPVLLLAAAATPVLAAPKAPVAVAPAPEAHDSMRPVIFLGDSLTAGYGLSPEEAYPALVALKVRSEKIPFRVVNGGSSGDTSSGGLRRLPWLLKQKPVLLVVALGANDMLRGVSPQETEKNLDQIIRKAKESGAAVALLGLRALPNLGPKYRAEFDAIFGRIARKHSIPFLPFFIEDVAGDPKLNQADGIHPTAEGQKKVAARVSKFVIPILKDLSTLKDPSKKTAHTKKTVHKAHK